MPRTIYCPFIFMIIACSLMAGLRSTHILVFRPRNALALFSDLIERFCPLVRLLPNICPQLKSPTDCTILRMKPKLGLNEE